MGNVHIGVRSSSATLHDGLRHALTEHVVNGVDAPPNYSVSFAEEPGVFHFLYWGGSTVVRTLDPARLLRGLFDHLSSHNGKAVSALRLNAFVTVRGGAALLAPPKLRSELPRLQPLLSRHGFVVVDAPWADIDLETAELVLAEPELCLDQRAVRGILAAATCARREPEVEYGRYPIAAWAVTGMPTDVNRPLGRAEATIRAVGMCPMPVAPSTLAAIGHLLGTVPGHALALSESPHAVVEGLHALMSLADGARR